MNTRRGVHRLLLLISLGIAVAVLYNWVSASLSEYKFFSMMESGDPMFRDIPEEVLGKGYSLQWILAKNLSLDVLVAAAFFIGSYLMLHAFIKGLRLAIRLISWPVRWVYIGFKTNAESNHSDPSLQSIQKNKKSRSRLRTNKKGAQ